MPISELICGQQNDSTFMVNFKVVRIIRESVIIQQRGCLENQ
jgi:hypothetical protein